MSREIVQIAAHGGVDDDGPEVIALCDDGTLWNISKGADWTKVPPIPQPDEAEAPEMDAERPDPPPSRGSIGGI